MYFEQISFRLLLYRASALDRALDHIRRAKRPFCRNVLRKLIHSHLYRAVLGRMLGRTNIHLHTHVHPSQAVIIFSLSGFFNVLLLHFTRPGLLLFGPEVVRTGRGRAPSPSPTRQPARSEPDSSRPFGGLNDDDGWDLEMSHTPRSHLSVATVQKQADRLGVPE